MIEPVPPKLATGNGSLANEKLEGTPTNVSDSRIKAILIPNQDGDSDMQVSGQEAGATRKSTAETDARRLEVEA